MKGGVHVDAWCTLCTICQDFKQNSAAVIAYLWTKSRCVTNDNNDNKLRVIGVPCSFYILHELVKSEIVGLEIWWLLFYYVWCQKFEPRHGMVAIFFWFYSKPDSIVILHFDLKKDFLLFWRHNWVYPTNIPVWAFSCKRPCIVGIYMQYVQFFQQIFVDSGWEFPSINSVWYG